MYNIKFCDVVHIWNVCEHFFMHILQLKQQKTWSIAAQTEQWGTWGWVVIPLFVFWVCMYQSTFI